MIKTDKLIKHLSLSLICTNSRRIVSYNHPSAVLRKLSSFQTLRFVRDSQRIERSYLSFSFFFILFFFSLLNTCRRHPRAKVFANLSFNFIKFPKDTFSRSHAYTDLHIYAQLSLNRHQNIYIYKYIYKYIYI